jgi:hypothetical protein
MKIRIIGAIVAGLLVAAGVIFLLESADAPRPAPARSAPVALYTYTLGAGGDAGAEVYYSCPESDSCGPVTLSAESPTWTTQVSVPAGERLTVSVRSSSVIVPRCWIGDAADSRPALNSAEEANEAACELVAGK